MNEKPEALALADAISYPDVPLGIEAAAELRRQHEEIERLTKENERLRDELRQSSIDYTRAENERLREALDKSLTDEQIRQIAASIDRLMPIEPAKILFARRIEAALRREEP